MGKSLDQMTPEELGILFPIIISDPDPQWPGLYRKEESAIRQVFGEPDISRIIGKAGCAKSIPRLAVRGK